MLVVIFFSLVAFLSEAAETNSGAKTGAGDVVAHSDGLHGYIGFSAERPPARSAYSAGMGFYSAVWPLVDKPLANFQIGLAGSWITPDNSDNKDKPLAPEGTLARTWKERGPTWSSVFQTLEGGLGYWAGNHFRYGPPKFSMNATPQCYDYEVGSPGWSFFYSNEALPDNRLGIAQLSNRLLIPPDGLPFQGNPSGEFLGYTYMALPFTDPGGDDPPTGDQSWTCFLSAANFKGPIAFYIPETWSKIAKLFNYPFLYGRGLDARPGEMGGGAMEINTVPRFEAKDARGVVYAKIPKLQFPTDDQGRAFLVQDVTYYSKAALWDAFKSWRNGGPACSGRFDEQGAWKSKLTTRTTRYDQARKKISGVERTFDTKVFEGNVWGLQWFTNEVSAQGLFPQYFKEVGAERVAIAAAEVPAETGLRQQEFMLAKPGDAYTSPTNGAWAQPGSKAGPLTARLADGSVVTFAWYRFIDQPSFQQYHWSEAKKAALQALVEKIHATWTIDEDYMAPPSQGKLVALDPALVVTPPKGLEVGYVPIVIGQAAQRTADRVEYLRGLSQELARQWPANRTLNIVCHGHSVPAGYFKTPMVETFNAYPHLLHRGLKERFPNAVVNVIVTAIGGENSESGARRFERDVLALRPDLVTIDYGLNDRGIGLARAEAAWREMIQGAGRAGAKVILLTPTPDTSARLDDPNDPLNQHADQIRRLARENGVGLVDSLALFQEQLRAGEPLDSLMSQVNHPSRRGHELVAADLLRWFP